MTSGEPSSFRDQLASSLAAERAAGEAAAHRKSADEIRIEQSRELYNRALAEAAGAFREAGIRGVTRIYQTNGLFGYRNHRYHGWPVYIALWVPDERVITKDWTPRDPGMTEQFNASRWRITDGRLEHEHSGMDERENWELFDYYLARHVAAYITKSR